MARSQSGCGGWPLPIRRGECFSCRRKLPHTHRNERHRVVAEDVDHLDRHGVAPWPVIGMQGGCQFQAAVLASAETLPFVLKDIAAGSTLLELNFSRNCN